MNSRTARGVREFFETCGDLCDMQTSEASSASKTARITGEEVENSGSERSSSSSRRQQLFPKKGQKRARPGSSKDTASSTISSTQKLEKNLAKSSSGEANSPTSLLMGETTRRSDDLSPKMTTTNETNASGAPIGNSGSGSISGTRSCSDEDGGNPVQGSSVARRMSRGWSYLSRNNLSSEEERRRNDIRREKLTTFQRVSSYSLEGVVNSARKMNEYRIFAGKVVNDERMQLFIVILITINAIMLGLGTFSFVQDDPSTLNIFEAIDKFFLVLFTIELGFQFLYRGWNLLRDAWLTFDLVIITLSWVFSNVQIIRAFRIFRALRLVTRIKVMKNLILAMFGVMPRMGAICLLLLLIFYIFSVMFTDLFRDLHMKNEEMEYDYFSRMDSTFFSLFQLMTLDDWVTVARQTMAVYSWAWLPFITFVIISGFIIFNLIIAVICDAVAALDDDNQDRLYGRYMELELEQDESGGENEIINVKEHLDYLESEMDKMQRMQEETVKLVKLLLEEKTASPAMKKSNRSNGAPLARGISKMSITSEVMAKGVSKVSITSEPTNNSGREFIAKKRASRTMAASLEKNQIDSKKTEDGDS